MLRGALTITLLNLAEIPKRIGASLVVVIGIAGVVGVLISVLAMADGFLNTMERTGRPDRAIVLRGGSNSELASTLARDATLAIMDGPGVKADDSGHAIASAEMVAIVELPLRQSGTAANVTLRGVGPAAFRLRPDIRIVAGRTFKPGLREVIVGKNAMTQFSGIDPGSRVALRDSEWTVVGVFDSDDSHGSEIMADVDTLSAAYRRTLFQSVTVLLDSPDRFDAFKSALEHDPRLSVEVVREPAYYARLSEQLGRILTFVAYTVGGIMALGALFGALNTMYSAVSSRSVEIATLRALGFGAGAILISVFTEAVLLSLLGAVIGAAAAWAFFNGNAVNSLGGNFTQVVFHLRVSAGLVATGILWAVVIGLLGGLFPALRAVRRPVVDALRGAV
ncbi:MAG: ABC transporter permease [Telmatospirillum sp.]|nr:ABC transporter permease [Telmatospirillum sp.]